MMNQSAIKLFQSEFVEFSINRIIDFLDKLKLEKENEQNTDFVKREPTPLLVYKTLQEKKESIKQVLNELTKKYPRLIKLEGNIIEIIKAIETSSNALQLLDKYLQIIETENTYLNKKRLQKEDNVFVWANKEAVFLSLENFKNNISASEETNINLLSNIIDLNQQLRDEERQATLDESILIQLGYSLLEKSQHLPHKFQYLGTYGFREIQTYLSLADPGEGHINITTETNELLRGLVVHVEHIDRDKETDKERVEAYRLPSPINIAKVRLHVGDKAPTTVFVGRPMFENLQINSDRTFSNSYFKTDILKSVHYTAAICNKMFSLGIADCKIAIERMTFSQSLEFMKALVGNCQRDIDLQFLSAAFNINTPIIDDRDTNNVVTVKDRFKIALLGIELASLAGFNKITWDGASNETPSRSIIKLNDNDDKDRGQLTSIQVLELVHLAHEKGLETYISAGMKNEHMEPATYTGVDGVGIGTSLHYKTSNPTINGALNRNAIKETLAVRDRSQNQLRGKGAKLLAALDRLHFEGLLTTIQETKRLELYEALRQKNESAISKSIQSTNDIVEVFRLSKAEHYATDKILKSNAFVSTSKLKTEHPVIERAERKIQFLQQNKDKSSLELLSKLNDDISKGNIFEIKNQL